MERLAPELVTVVREGRAYRAPVVRAVAHPPHHHPEGCPIRPGLTALELVTDHGSRWWGFGRAWIGADLRMHVAGWDARNELVRAWERPS